MSFTPFPLIRNNIVTLSSSQLLASHGIFFPCPPGHVLGVTSTRATSLTKATRILV